MKWEGAGTTTGTVEGYTFTINTEGMIFAYRKCIEQWEGERPRAP